MNAYKREDSFLTDNELFTNGTKGQAQKFSAVNKI